jgi:hypothetical protein
MSQATQEAMSAAQRGTIFSLARAAKLDRDALHDIVRREAHRDSIGALTKFEAIRVIDELKTIAGQTSGQQAGMRVGYMSPAQENKIFALCRQMGWVEEESGQVDQKRLNGFVKARFGVYAWRWVDAQKAGLIIEALKKMAAAGRGERKRQTDAD